MGEAVSLSQHTFAHHVMEVILQRGTAEQRQKIVAALLADFWRNAQNDNSSYVIASAMVHCDAQELQVLIEVIVAGTSEQLGSLLRTKARNHVLKALLQLPAHLTQNVLKTVVSKLQATEYANAWYAKRLVQQLNMKANPGVPV